MKKRLCSVLVCCMFLCSMIIFPLPVTAQQNGTQPDTYETTYIDMSYAAYKAVNSDKSMAKSTILIKASDATSKNGAVESGDSAGLETQAVEIPEGASLKWTFTCDESGLYNLLFDYFPLTGRLTDIELSLQIDEETPFDEARKINLSRIWMLSGPVKRDNNGNDIRPRQEEATKWMSEYAADKNGYVTDNFFFYLSKGQHTVSITMTRDTIALKSLTFEAMPAVPAYSEVSAGYNSDQIVQDYFFKRQAEDTFRISHSMIYANNDRGNPAVEPSDPSKIRLNSIGMVNWDKGGQWVSWEIQADKDGLYEISFKYRQNAVRGFSTARKLYIDDQVPFSEMNMIEFPYTSGQKWVGNTLSSTSGKPYLFYLTKGKHVLKLEVVSGKAGSLLAEVNDVIYSLNDLYRQIIMVTGTSPDSLRDYYLDQEIPGLISTMSEQSYKIKSILKRFEALSSDKKGSQASFMKEVSNQLDSFVKKPETIPTRLKQFQNNISSLANLNLSLKNQPLQLDFITVTGAKHKPYKLNAGFFETVAYRFMSFISSFYEDYDAVGNTYEGSSSYQPIDVWVSANDLATSGYASGRDQMSVIKRLIDDKFVSEYKTFVNLRLVDSSSTLTQAILARQGPDCALIVPSQTPINLAMRDALIDLTGLKGFDDTRPWFYKSAFIPYEFNGGVYALPETQLFWMMFYREDIFKQFNVTPPDTWSDFYEAVNILMKNNMQIGMPENLQIFETFLFQNSATYYNLSQTATALDNPNAVAAFTEWTNLYTNYSFPMEFDPFSRFRTGEMPLVFMPYSFYNQLSVGAPEIANMWKMLPMPAREVDGEMSRVSSSAGTGAIILRDAQDTETCFNFIKWWVSPEIQAEFGIEIEAVLGPAARYNAANVEAFKRLPWSAVEQKAIEEQWKDVWAMYNVPGNYYVSRCLTNAFRRVCLYFDNPRETLQKYNLQINNEIKKKREELGLN